MNGNLPFDLPCEVWHLQKNVWIHYQPRGSFPNCSLTVSETICVSCFICNQSAVPLKSENSLAYPHHVTFYNCFSYMFFLFGSMLYNFLCETLFFLSLPGVLGIHRLCSWLIWSVSFFFATTVLARGAFARQVFGESDKLGSCKVRVAITSSAATEARSSRLPCVAADVWVYAPVPQQHPAL